MRSNNIGLLPAGVFEMTPDKTAFIRRVEETLLAVFTRWGYREIRTPAIEYLDTMSRGLGDDELDMAFKLVDRATGKLMVLRSDVTPQVARMVSMAMSGIPLPLRLCYVADVYRHADDPNHPRRELIHAGVELVGVDDPQADAEVLAVGAEALAGLGMTGIRMSVGQVQYARGLFKEAAFSTGTEDAVVTAACRKDRGEMEILLDRERVDGRVADAVLALVELSGTREVLDRARDLAPNDVCRGAIENLDEILDLARIYGVGEEQITVDLGDLATFRYHTGAVFTGYVAGSGRAVLRGGRYDGLVEKYGRPAPATGFGVDILEAVEVTALSGTGDPAIDYLLVNRTGDRAGGLRMSVALRDKGKKVLCLIRDIPDRDLGAYISAHRIGKVLVMEEGAGMTLYNPDTGEKEPFDPVDL
ncbi:MAG: ATP phosphoribosyltransferase regulatory subunit [bacterium]|nr:ATP phosphoribosyltransferase regulatory subunit [bacterium]MDT8396346.1 ATP phosphoribosyltransferase regulatory subunit [bacterium]